MKPHNSGLPLELVAANTAVAGLAAFGLLFMAPIPVNREISAVLVPVLAVLLAITLVKGGERFIERVRDDAYLNATSDPDTGLTTLAAARDILALEFAAAQRGRPLTVVLFRIEDLAGYGARHGRAVGEQLLRSAGRLIQKRRRRMHVSAHYRIDGTYLTILSGSHPKGASVYARRLRKDLLRMPGVPAPSAVSAAVVPFDLSMRTPGDLLSQTERALRTAGHAGGKVVVVGQQKEPETRSA